MKIENFFINMLLFVGFLILFMVLANVFVVSSIFHLFTEHSIFFNYFYIYLVGLIILFIILFFSIIRINENYLDEEDDTDLN